MATIDNFVLVVSSVFSMLVVMLAPGANNPAAGFSTVVGAEAVISAISPLISPPSAMAFNDALASVPVANSLRYYSNLVQNKVPASLLIFEKGGHGPGAFKNNPSWLGAFEQWLKKRGAM